MKPETSTAWSIGADMVPPAAPGLSLSATYFNVDYKGKIRNVGTFSEDFLTQEAQLASLITRNPTPAQLAATCKGIARFVPDSTGNCSDPITVIIDARFRNLARTRTSGVDLAVDQAIDTTRGKWAFGLQGTYVLNFDQQITNTAPVYDYVDTVGNPLKLRLAAHLSWSFRHWTVLTTVNYSGAYENPGSVPERVDSWTTVDMNLGYRIDGGQGWMAHTQCNFGVNNLFDLPAPFVNQYDLMSGNFGYDSANGSLIGRQVSLQFVKRWGR
jgi:outer membrane receptor for ferrienterochelin and colicin